LSRRAAQQIAVADDLDVFEHAPGREADARADLALRRCDAVNRKQVGVRIVQPARCDEHEQVGGVLERARARRVEARARDVDACERWAHGLDAFAEDRPTFGTRCGLNAHARRLARQYVRGHVRKIGEAVLDAIDVRAEAQPLRPDLQRDRQQPLTGLG